MKALDPAECKDNEEQASLKVQGELYAKMQAVLDALENFVAAESWTEAKHVVEAHRDELLTDAADDVLVTLLARYKDTEVIRVLLQHRQVLMRCRVVGIDVAFAELVATDDVHDVCPPGVDPTLWQRVLQINSFAALMDFLVEYPDLTPYIQRRVLQILGQDSMILLDGLLALLGATTWSAAREIIHAVPALLSLEADIWLMQYAEFSVCHGDHESVAVITMRRWLLARCRMFGVDTAFLGWRAQQDGIRVDREMEPAELRWLTTGLIQAV